MSEQKEADCLLLLCIVLLFLRAYSIYVVQHIRIIFLKNICRFINFFVPLQQKPSRNLKAVLRRLNTIIINPLKFIKVMANDLYEPRSLTLNYLYNYETNHFHATSLLRWVCRAQT